MKVLFVHCYMHIKSGAGKIMFSEAELLRQKGHEVLFFTTDKQPYIKEEEYFSRYFPKFIDFRNLPWHKLPKYLFRLFYNREAEEKLDLMLREQEPDIVHIHEWGAHLTPSVLSACYRNNIPAVMTIHGPGFFCPGQTMLRRNGDFCGNAPCLSGNYWPCLLHRCLKSTFLTGIGTVFLKYLHKNIFGLVNRIPVYICPSRALFDMALRAGIPEQRLALVHNFVEESISRKTPNYSGGGYFLYIGRLDEQKGVHFLIEAMKMLPKSIELHIAGTGPQEQSLKQMAQRLQNIKFLGFVSGREIEKEYEGCIASILPCNWFEAFGLTVIESFAYGKPVIASNVGGIPEIVEHNVNGILTEPGNPQQLVRAILKLNNSPELAINMGKHGRKRLETQFNPEVHYNKLIEVYKQVENIIH